MMTIHYHGTPITPEPVMLALAGRSFCVSYADARQDRLAHRIGQSVMLDNGAFSQWRAGKPTNWPGFYAWADAWLDHASTWAVIPDVIDGTEEENDELLLQWPHGTRGAPVWHLHESLHRLVALAEKWPRICFGSSGDYAQVGTEGWHARVELAFDELVKRHRRLPWVHMMRGMALAGSIYPFASVDSTNIARNAHRKGPERRADTARRMAERIDAAQCPGLWEVA